MYEEVYASGAMIKTIDQYSTLLHSVNAEPQWVDITTYDAAMETFKSFITQRLEHLEMLEVTQG